jgi:HEAT repeat protein
MAIGIHDAAQVSAVLKDMIRRSSMKDVRETAVFWLGIVGGEQQFLAGIVRNEQEHVDVRESAAAAIGRSRDAAALTLLQELYGQVAVRDIKEQILSSISRNDDQKAATAFLAKVAKTDQDRELREAAIHRLGRLPGTQTFLADVVRNEQEVSDVREAAVHAMGRSSDAGALSTLQSLYKTVSDKQVREAIIHAVKKNQNQQEAMSFLVEVVKTDPLSDMRETAVHSLGRMAGAQSLLLEIARNESEMEDVRQAAVHQIAKSGDASALATLQSLYEATSNEGVKEIILHSISKNQDQDAALRFIIQVAESDRDRELREQAVSRLSRFSSPQSFEALKRIAVSASSDNELQEQAVHAISKRPADESVPALIEIAKSHPRQEIRETAIRRLSRSNDERAREFLKQLLSN